MTFRSYCFIAFLFAVAFANPVQAEDLRIEAKLIWGTNDEKSPDASHKPVDEALVKELGKIFKWKNYFEINRQNGVVPNRGTKQFQMSKQCVVEITELEGPKVEVKLIGEGKPVNKTVKALSRGEFFTIGGESKNGCAWFVVVTQQDENKLKAEQTKKEQAAAAEKAKKEEVKAPENK